MKKGNKGFFQIKVEGSGFCDLVAFVVVHSVRLVALDCFSMAKTCRIGGVNYLMPVKIVLV